MVAISTTFVRFNAETKLHGITRTLEGTKVSVLFWTTFVAVSIGMACKDVVQLVGEYQSERTTIQISLTNDPVIWPTPTLCMELLVRFGDDKSMSNIPFDQRNRFPINWSNQSKLLSLQNSQFDRFYQLADTVANYTVVDYGNEYYTNPNVMYYNYMMLGYLSELEQTLVGLDHSYLTNYQLNYGYNDANVAERVQKFYNYYKQRTPPVSISKLSKVVGMWYCLQQLRGLVGIMDPLIGNLYPNIYGQFENYRYFGDPNYISLPLCKANMITHLGFSMVCSKIFETPTVPFVPDYNYFAIYNSYLTQPPDYTLVNQIHWIDQSMFAKIIPNFRWHLDMEGRNVLPPDNDRKNVFSWSPGEDVVVDISVDTEYQFLNRKALQCSSGEESQYQCKWRKRVEYVYEQCGCWPSLVNTAESADIVNCSDFTYFSSKLPLSQKIYSLTPNMLKCKGNLSALDTTDCLPDCNIVEDKFTRQVTKKTFLDRIEYKTDPWTKSGSIEFRYTSYPRTVVVESFVNHWPTFLGTWGGSIGTWLGASLMAFIHVPVFMLQQYVLAE